MNAMDFSILLSTSTNKNSIASFFLKTCFSSLIDGISRIQGGHHIAQKLIKTTLPFKELKVTTFPSLSLNESSESSGGGISTFPASLARVFSLVFLFSEFLQETNKIAIKRKIPEMIG